MRNGPGVTNVAIDDLDVAGYVTVPQRTIDRSFSVTPSEAGSSAGLPDGPSPSHGADAERGAVEHARVRLQNGILRLANGHPLPLFPRIIQYQGEPLTLLERTGFNSVWLSHVPTASMLEEASRLGLWLIAPPPNPCQPVPPSGAPVPTPEIGPEYDGVLAWDLGSGLESQQLKTTVEWAKQIRMADRRNAGRMLICRPALRLKDYNQSEAADLIVVGRSPLGSSLGLNDYGDWIRQQPRLLNLGNPFWTMVQTQPAESLWRQWTALGQDAPPLAFSSEQVQLLTYTAMTAGSRGLVFESFSPLSATDPGTRMRALTLELLNRQLEIIEPWAAAGSILTTVPGTQAGSTATLFHCEYGRLLLPVWSPPGAQFVLGQAAGHRVIFTVPGIPDTNQPRLIAPGGLPSLDIRPETGGKQVALDEFDLTALVLLTAKDHIFQDVNQRAIRTGRRVAEIERELADLKLRAVQQVSARLLGRTVSRYAGTWLSEAKDDLAQCDAQLADRHDRQAYFYAQRAMRPLRLLERSYWDAAMAYGDGLAPLRSPVASPAAVAFPTLPYHWTLMERVRHSQPGPNILPGGGFESPTEYRESGWQYDPLQPMPAHVQVSANLTRAAAHSGSLGLELKVEPSDPAASPLWVESPPVRLVSPPVPVEAGQLLRIQGWVQIRKPIAGSVDGLVVFDSLGGECLAERIVKTKGWERFVLYRVVPQSGTMTLSFALSGFGEAWIDDVAIEVLRRE